MGYWDDKQVVNTDGAAGKAIYVGILNPSDEGYNLQIGDVWIRLPLLVYPATVSTSSSVPAPTVTTV